jgi:hypothetical protein
MIHCNRLMDSITSQITQDAIYLTAFRFRLTDYLELVDWTGRILQDDKRGAIYESTPQILQQLNIDPKHGCYLSKKI